MLITELSHFSWWSKVHEAVPVAKAAAECLTDSLGPSPKEVAEEFLRCMINDGFTDLNSAIETRILSDLLPKNCWGALATDGLVAGAGGGPVATLSAVLSGIINEPACTGTAGSYGVPAPTVSKVSPDSGPASGGTTVTITGWMFATASSVTFGGREASSFTIGLNSNDTITAVAPPGTAGTVNVRVGDGGGASQVTVADRYTYMASGAAPTTSPSSSGPTPAPGSTGGTAGE